MIEQRIIVMKKVSLAAIALCLTSLTHASYYFETSQKKPIGRSFLYTRPVSYRLAINQQAWHSIAYSNAFTAGGALQVSMMYTESIPTCKNNGYFLFDGNTQLLVAGDASGYQKVRNVRAEWLNLPSTFYGYMRLIPKQKQGGIAFEYTQQLDHIFDSSLFEGSWFGIYMPILVAKNTLELCQSDIRGFETAAPGQPKNLAQAFSQPAWHDSRILSGKTRGRPAEIRLSLGKTYLDEDLFQILYYSTLVIPTGNKQHATQMFDTVVGNNAHPALGGGVNFQVTLNEDISQMGWCFFTNLEALYLFRNEQCRTFDLKKKPWSRFMLYNLREGSPDQPIPGVNLLTLRALVRPFGFVDFSIGWRFKTEHIEGEFGYNVWGHSGERVKLLKCPFHSGPFGIAGVGTVEGNPMIPATASTSIISQQGANDPEFVEVKRSDIDLFSGSARSALNHQVHAALSAFYHCDSTEGFVGIGFFVDIPQKSGSLEYWGIWWKMGVSF